MGKKPSSCIQVNTELKPLRFKASRVKQQSTSHLLNIGRNKYNVYATAAQQIHNKEQVYQCPASNNYKTVITHS